MIVAIFILIASATLYAQPTTPAPTSPWAWYTSASGVVAATMLGVSILKRAIGDVPRFNAVPTWLYAVIVSGILTFLTSKVWHTLPGDFGQALSQTILLAGSSSGFYEWIKSENITKPLAASALDAGVFVEHDKRPDSMKRL